MHLFYHSVGGIILENWKLNRQGTVLMIDNNYNNY